VARRSLPWFVRRDVTTHTHAFFLSHVAEDAAEIADLKAAIEGYSGRGARTSLRCFVDVQNWQIGNDNGTVIRDRLLHSDHMVCWVTPSYVATTRGWVWMELAYAELIELSMNIAQFGLRAPFIVPVFYNVGIAQIERTPLLAYWQRQLAYTQQSPDIAEIARKLVDFHEQELRKREGL